jgi:MFS family permease
VSNRRRNINRFVLAAIITALIVLAVGWLTDVRQLLHWVLLMLAVTAFLPFVIIGGGLAIGLVLALTAAIFAGDASVGAVVGEGTTTFGAFIFHPYYRFLARRRHPVFWGMPMGLLLGCLLLGGVIALVIIPAETRTVQILAATQQQVERFHKKTGRFPTVDAEGRLTSKELGLDARGVGNDDFILDGFGRPLHFQVKGKGILASYTLISWGYDGKPGRDDLCISRASEVSKWAMMLADKLGISQQRKAPELTVLLRGVLDLQCPDEMEHR